MREEKANEGGGKGEKARIGEREIEWEGKEKGVDTKDKGKM